MMYKRFKKFLRKHKCSRAFNRNVRKNLSNPPCGYTAEAHFAWLCDCEDPASMIASSFAWNETPEGQGFWIDMLGKWLEHVRK